MMKDAISVALVPNQRTRYDKKGIYHDGEKMGMSCHIEAMIAEFGGEDLKWQANPRCMVQGYPQRDDDLMLSFYLPPSREDSQLATKIISGFFGPRGISLERT